ncbi:MAG: N-acetyl-gamma-glutamyl-phosphate/LysW-gamma-L-alpha-aminoadipyl-6-phosphate reductase [Planctomycetota bacterium]
MIRVSIIGGSGYAGGELLRLLLSHPEVEIVQVTSERSKGRFVHSVHPNLRGRTTTKFTSPSKIESVDLLFLALPHGEASKRIDEFAGCADRIVDLSADFRLDDKETYAKWYGHEHLAPEWLDKFVYGLPEHTREKLRGAKYASGVGCNATAVNLSLLPLAQNGLIESVVIEVKVGSSEGGAKAGPASHHPERVGCVRSFAPTGHRHQAEMEMVLGAPTIHFSATAVEMVRGVLCTAHVFLQEDLDEKSIWGLYRESYNSEPFVRIVKERTGLYRFPEPKILAGSNYADIGFQKDPTCNRVVVIGAIDNLVKGASGSAVQSMNLMCGFEETTGLDFAGLHPA